jgi:hypothetical protein
MDTATLIRVILICACVGLIGGLVGFLLTLIRHASRLLALIPGVIMLLLAAAAVIKAAFFSSGGFDDLGYIVMAILLGGAAIIALLCGLVIFLVRGHLARRTFRDKTEDDGSLTNESK